MKKVLTVKEFASMGGKARWKGKTAKEISKAMSAIRRGKVDKQAHIVSNVQKGDKSLTNHKQAR